MKKLLEIYINKYIKGKLDFFGIDLIPKIEGNDIFWDINNTKDLSFSRYAIDLFINDSLFNYFEIVGVTTTYAQFYLNNKNLRKIKLNREFYLSDKIWSEINEVLSKYKDFFYETSVGSNRFRIDFDFDFFDWDVTCRYDEIELMTKIIILKCKIDGVEIDDSFEELKKLFESMYDNEEIFDFYNAITSPFMDVLLPIRTLYVPGDMYINSNVNFYNVDGDRI